MVVTYYPKIAFSSITSRFNLKVLLTGCAGLIGSSLRTAFLNQNIGVLGFDHKLPHNHPDNGDILDLVRLEEAVRNCDGVIHLAAVSRVIWGEKNPDLCWQTNFEGTKNVLKCAFACSKPPWVLYASSREVYGNQEVLPVKESALLKPVNIYGHSKASAEEIILKARGNGLNTAIVRFSNVYGSINDHHDRVIPAFCLAAAKGLPLKVEGPHNTFDFTHVTDVAVGVLKIINKLSSGQKNLPPLHFTTGRATSLAEAARIANMAGGKASEIIEAPSRTFDVSNFYGDATQTMDILNWRPVVSIEDGIHHLLVNFKKNLNLNNRIDAKTHLKEGYHSENTQSNPWLSSSI
jgi:nucleoside-diphosphate-sugar epimerase